MENSFQMSCGNVGYAQKSIVYTYIMKDSNSKSLPSRQKFHKILRKKKSRLILQTGYSHIIERLGIDFSSF